MAGAALPIPRNLLPVPISIIVPFGVGFVGLDAGAFLLFKGAQSSPEVLLSSRRSALFLTTKGRTMVKVAPQSGLEEDLWLSTSLWDRHEGFLCKAVQLWDTGVTGNTNNGY